MENTQESLEERRRRLLEELQLLDQQIAESSEIQQQPAPKPDIPETESTQQAPQENIEENNENQQLQSNTNRQVDQISSNEPETDVQPTVSSNFSFYEKRKGVVDLGKGYEYLTCALYALKFGLDDNISDFHMTTNNKKCGDFDDIEIEATFKNGKRSTFLFQLKHKFNKDYITEGLLTNENIHKNKKQQKSKFYLPHYLQSISNFEKQDEDLHFILYTNSQTAIRDGSVLSFNKKYTSLLVENCSNLEYKELLVNSDDDENKIFKVKPNADSETEELKSVANVCSKFYFFTNQDDVENVKGRIKVKLDNLLQGQYDILDPFIQFMEYWWLENFVLTKHLLLVKLTELALSPYIKTLTGKRTNEKTDLLKQAIMNFEMTIVNKSQEDIVVNMWKEVEENNDCNTSPLDQYAQQRKTELSSVQKAKILWHWGKIPLIITVDKSNANVVERVMKLLHKSLQNKKIVLLTDDSNYQFHGWSIFKTLSDIIENHPNEEYCSNIKNKFNVSLQGRNYIPLSHLLQTDLNIARYVRTEDLFVMSQCQYMLIGKQVEKLPDLYIPRTVYANFINIQEIFKLAGLMRNNAIIINCDKSFTNTLVKYFEVIELSDYLSTENVKLNNNCIFVSTKSKCDDKKFDEFCDKSKKQNVYLLQIVDQEYCTLIRRRGKQAPFHFTRKYIEEANIFANFKDLLNVFCAPPGMGKTSLLKILTYNCPRDCWAVNVDLINYNSVFAKESNIREMLGYFVEVKDSQDDLLTKHIVSTLLRDKKMHVFFDGLDEVHSNYVKFAMNCIQHLLSEGVNVWVTSRENLREQLSQTLNIVPIDIEEIKQNEQKSYIYDRLIDKYQPEEIQKITTAMSNSVDLNRSQGLLGIPLQLYIITEMFLNNKQLYEDLMQEGLFVLTKMYRMFFDGKIESSYKKVIGDKQEHQLGVIRLLLKQYELVAMKTCLDSSDFEILALNTQESQEFIDELKSNGDKYGIIKSINEYEEVVFNHQTYAEYFASVWFKKHQDKVRLLGRNFFSKRYENLRIMFDVMMAEKNPLHLAVIYKDIDQCEKQIENVGTKDEAGRNALHIASSYGMNYPEDEARINRESTTYTKIIAMLFGKPEIKFKIAERDDLFNFDCVEYALASKCLYVIETLFEKSLLTFQELQALVFQFYDEKALVYYAAQMGYFNLFFEIITSNPSIDKKQIHRLLCTAVLGARDDVGTIERPREGNIKIVELLIKYDVHLNKMYLYSTIMNDAFDCELQDMWQVLTENGAKFADGDTILHRLLDDEDDIEANEEFIIYLLDNWNVNVNVQNIECLTPLHKACENGRHEIVKKLFEKGADAKILTWCNFNLLDYVMLETEPDKTMMDILINHVDINEKNVFRFSLLDRACEEGNVELVAAVLNKGTNVNNLNRCYFHGNALHIALSAKDENVDIIELLLQSGIDINLQNKKGQTPLHIACKTCKYHSTQLLLTNGAEINTVDIKNKNALHHAAKNWEENREIIFLLIENGIDGNCESNDGSVPLQVAREKNDNEIVEKLLQNDSVVNLDKKNSSSGHTFEERSNNNSVVNSNLSSAFHLERGKLQHTYETNANLNNIVYPNDLVLIFNRQSKYFYLDLENTILLGEVGFDADRQGITALQMACYEGDFEMAESLMKVGAKAKVVDNDGNTALHYASVSNEDNQELIPLLIIDGVDVNAQNKYGQTPLQLAFLRGHSNNILQLFTCGAKCDIEDNKKNNALHYALVERDDVENIILSLWTDNRLDINCQNQYGITPLHIACECSEPFGAAMLTHFGANASVLDSNKNNVLHYLMRSEGDDDDLHMMLVVFLDLNIFDINTQNIYGTTALHLACQYCHYKLVKVLLLEEAKVDILDNDNNSALHYASYSNKSSEKLIRLLLRRGLNINELNKNGVSPLHLACNCGNLETAQILLANGANINDVDYNGNNALHYASSSTDTNTNLITLLLDNGLNVNCVNKYGASPLHFARKSDNIDVLLEAGAQLQSLDNNNNNILHYVSRTTDKVIELLNYVLSAADFNVNAQNNCGTTPLQLACRSGNFLFVKELYEHGAELNILDNDKKSALHYALESSEQNNNLINYLIYNGIDVNVQDNHGKTPLELACSTNNYHIVETLIEFGAGAEIS